MSILTVVFIQFEVCVLENILFIFHWANKYLLYWLNVSVPDTLQQREMRLNPWSLWSKGNI